MGKKNGKKWGGGVFLSLMRGILKKSLIGTMAPHNKVLLSYTFVPGVVLYISRTPLDDTWISKKKKKRRGRGRTKEENRRLFFDRVFLGRFDDA